MPPDEAKISTELLLSLHSGLEVIKSRQSEINRRLGKLEEAVEALAQADEEDAKAPVKWLEYFIQGLIYVAAVTASVYVGSLLGIEVQW